MLLKATLLLTSEIVAERRTHRCIRVFDRDGGRIRTQLATWEWAFKTAAGNLRIDRELDLTSIRPEPTWFAPVETELRRSYRGRNGAKQTERFQCVPAGTEITHRFVISAGPDSHAGKRDKELREPDAEQFLKMLSHIGYFLGVSPWGNRYGHGRFTVRALELDGDATIPESSTDPEISGALLSRLQRPDDIPDTGYPPEDDDDRGSESGPPEGDGEEEGPSIYDPCTREIGPYRDDLSGSVEEAGGDSEE